MLFKNGILDNNETFFLAQGVIKHLFPAMLFILLHKNTNFFPINRLMARSEHFSLFFKCDEKMD